MSQKILHYSVDITDGTGIISRTNEFKVKELNVIGENDSYLVVDDWAFTTISKKATDYHKSLGVEDIWMCANDSCWGNRITYSLFTFEPKKANAIKRAIERKIVKKYGFFIGKIDLSIIREN